MAGKRPQDEDNNGSYGQDKAVYNRTADDRQNALLKSGWFAEVARPVSRIRSGKYKARCNKEEQQDNTFYI